MEIVFDESLFKKIVIVLLVAIVIVGAVAVFRFSGVFRDGGDVPVSPGSASYFDPLEPDFQDQKESISGWKSYSWSYRGTPMEMDLFISDDAYQQFVTSSHGTHEEKPQRMAEYVVTEGDNGIIGTAADWFLATSRVSGFGDSDTVGNVLAFVVSLNYTTDEERRQTGAYPNYPVITLAAEGGDSEDHAILAAAILDKIGYGVSLLYYPAVYDRRTIIPEATALGLITDGTIPGRLFRAVAEAPAGRLVYYPGNDTCIATLPDGGDPEYGWYAGNAVRYHAAAVDVLGDVRYYPANRTFVIGTDVSDADMIVVEDAVWNQPVIVSAAWTVDTAEKGVECSAYDGMDPLFIGGGGLWLGRPLSRDDRLDSGTTIAGKQPLGDTPLFSAEESLTTLLRVPVSGMKNPPSAVDWLESTGEYYTSTWYPAGIAWAYDDKWKLHDNLLAMQDTLPQNPEAYSLWGAAEVPAPVPWRIAYTVHRMDKGRSEKEMTPYSDVRFAVYRIVDDVAVLEQTFGWQTRFGAELRKSESVFGPGNYAVAVFVRNCEVDVAIEYHGKPNETMHPGGI